MKQQESQRKGADLLHVVADCQAKYREVIEAFASGNLCVIPRDSIVLVRARWTILVTITRPLTDRLRAELSDVP